MAGEADSHHEAGTRLAKAVAEVAHDVVRHHAALVDADARFPAESMGALRGVGALGAMVPTSLGGLGCSVTEVAATCRIVGAECASTAMILAMHHIQVASIVRHRRNDPFFEKLLETIASEQLLIASATSEAGVGGDIRSSRCAVEREGSRFLLRKSCPVISYGSFADGLLVTARSNLASSPSDQVLVYVPASGAGLVRVTNWDALGMRGTDSAGFELTAEGSCDQILPDAFGDIAIRTMLPVSHLLWGSVWIGIAAGALGRARRFARATQLRDSGVQPLSAPRLVGALAKLEALQASLDGCLLHYEHVADDPKESTAIRWLLRLNNLKLTLSTGVLEIASAALSVCGMAGYRNDTEFSVGRFLRDAASAELMIHNDRIMSHNASLIGMTRGEL